MSLMSGTGKRMQKLINVYYAGLPNLNLRGLKPDLNL
jgi:hypothetical protein